MTSLKTEQDRTGVIAPSSPMRHSIVLSEGAVLLIARVGSLD